MTKEEIIDNLGIIARSGSKVIDNLGIIACSGSIVIGFSIIITFLKCVKKIGLSIREGLSVLFLS